MFNIEIIVNLIGWLGAICSLSAYFLVSSNRLSGTSVKFQTLNIMGGLFVFINSAYHGAIPSAVINIIWIGIALLSLTHFTKKTSR